MAIDFKNNEILIPLNHRNLNNRQVMDSGSESAFFGSWSSTSSSSFLTTSFGSELDSNETDRNEGDEEEEEDDDDDDEFIAQLTRQMADYMLDEEDNGGDIIPDNAFPKPNFQEAIDNHRNQKQTRRSYADTVKKSLVGFQSEQSISGDKQLPPPIQMYKVEDQPRVIGKQSGGGMGRKGKMSESTQQQQQHVRHHHRHVRGTKEYVNGGKGGYCNGGGLGSVAVGSGMRAIFLGGSGSRNVTSGTGVFLPRSATDATDHGRKKTGCSTVLVPTRVLQALEQHFNNMETLSPHHNPKAKKDKKQTCESVSVDHQDPKLPQEWIY